MLADLITNRYPMLEAEVDEHSIDLWLDKDLIVSVIQEGRKIVVLEYDSPDDDPDDYGEVEDEDEPIPKEEMRTILERIDEVIARRLPGTWANNWW